MYENHEAVDKWEMPFVWIFTTIVLYSSICLMLGEFIIPFEWLYDGVVNQHQSVGETIANEFKKGLNYGR